MIDSTITLSVSLLITPKMHRILTMLKFIACDDSTFRVIVDSTKHASHAYRVMVDSTIALSMSLLIAPKIHRIIIFVRFVSYIF